MPDDRRGRLDPTVRESPHGTNTFQARFVILHNRRNDVAACPPPGYWVRSWGGPPDGRDDVKPALDISRAPRRAIDPDRLLLDRIPSLGLTPRRPHAFLDPSSTPMVVDEHGFLALR
jgi:hypothetical protein